MNCLHLKKIIIAVVQLKLSSGKIILFKCICVSSCVILPTGHAVTQVVITIVPLLKSFYKKTRAENLHLWLMHLFFWIYKCMILWYVFSWKLGTGEEDIFQVFGGISAFVEKMVNFCIPCLKENFLRTGTSQ